ncbi:MAG: NAD(+) synthase [Verrucomicrobia bacterium]|nr:NAD(+) synthase [Verrucomicrobiota bacterium]
MRLLKVAAAVLNQTPLDWNGNRQRILGAIAQARAQQASVLCLPELCITGYGCEDAFQSPNTMRQAWRVLEELLPATRGLIVSFGLPLLYRHGLFNCAALAVDGRIAGFVAKRFLAGEGIHYEPRWFKAWPTGVRGELTVDGRAYPIGDLHFECGGVGIGFEICEDAWVAARPGTALAMRGVDVILNPSASHFAFGKIEVRKRFVLEGSRAFCANYVYANLLGNEAGRAIYDGGALIASAGRLIGAGPRFGFYDWHVTSAVLDLDATRLGRARQPGSPPPAEGAGAGPVHAPFAFPETPFAPPALEASPWESSRHLKEEEFMRAEALALFDYLRRSRSRGFVVSLSGGADSSAISCLVHLMVALGTRDLGAGFAAKLDYIPGLDGLGDARALTGRLLTTVYQASANSGAVTRQAARAVAEAVGSRHYEFDVGPLVRGYVETVEAALGVKLNWREHDVALQNIQARVRSPGAWMLANLNGALLLATSNRSEAAVGYATMDGDTSGGLSPLAGIDKAWLRHWLHWLETTGPLGLHPIPALAAVTRQAPTAELRPPDRHQTDEHDLMPYPLLDAIERAAIRDKQAPLEVFQRMQTQFPEYPAPQLASWVERFFRLWCRNQWKRERYAPSFHLDDENLDPKTWCRWPILSGGFEHELAELRDHVAALARDPVS